MTKEAKAPAPPGLAEALERARAVRPLLESVTDGLNATIIAAEAAIAQLNLGVRASINLWSNDDGPEYMNLAFMRVGRNWQLRIEEFDENHPPDYESTTPLINTSRETRLSAVERLPDLVKALVEAAEKEVERVQQAMAAVKSLIDSVTPASSQGQGKAR